ncbi:MAG: hypothetical protein JNN20_12830 [Betaproteobacteria bacterium]|nr:hypothetical protein [Betaproteobacteria bacterium]
MPAKARQCWGFACSLIAFQHVVVIVAGASLFAYVRAMPFPRIGGINLVNSMMVQFGDTVSRVHIRGIYGHLFALPPKPKASSIVSLPADHHPAIGGFY